MLEFLNSLGFFGWIVLLLAAIGIVALPRALREMWTRPWKRTDLNGTSNGSDQDVGASDTRE